jgi:hypothetical protein
MRIGYLAALILALAVAGCNGSSSASARGSWGGSTDNCMDGCLGAVTLNLDAGGQFTFDDIQSLSTYTGTYQTEGARTILLNESGGGEGVFIMDSTLAHGGFFVEFSQLQVGVLQRGASGPTGTYLLSDLYGSWAGQGLIPDDNFNVTATFYASATFADSTCSPCAAFTWTDSTGSSLADSWTYIDPVYGGDVDYTNNVFWSLSPDRKFLGASVCTTYPSAPSDCKIEGLTRQ